MNCFMKLTVNTMSKKRLPVQAGYHPIRVWDLPLRLFHWTLVILILGSYVSSRFNRLDWHTRLGKAILALLIFRLLWGAMGSDTARFANFLTSPATAWRYVCNFFSECDLTHAGHTPAGGWMVATFIVLLILQVLTGLYVHNDVVRVGSLFGIFPAPIADALVWMHGFLFHLLMYFVALHVSVIMLYRVAKGRNLLRPMITGKQLVPLSVKAPRSASALRALLLALCAGGIAALIIQV
ncbi:cytochrome b [Paraburkholderia sp. BL8N3]|nr:cytochrome b [Paraburkholderia sp. BL8N3]